ncbi:DUF4133 domain-containing protein [Proteiniphilum sp. UBA5346]|uniref:DUF4133 domain-containing protein n=1 Tax=Proteiniphilum sp. UBA5346 TaxID=1947277 RepID=UPI00257ED4E4|nr:DUF4133 domain-containing protein [Proteiniphilum sp. UBA5346]
MAKYEINKGVGRSVEFHGLKAQYLSVFAGGLLAIFILVAVLYMIGVNHFFCLLLGVAGGIIIVWQTFLMNRKYREHGLMKLGARKNHPRYLLNRKRVRTLFKEGGRQ